jgi:hypothetical protein
VGVEVQLYSFFNLGARWLCVVNATPRPLYHGAAAGWALGIESRWVRKISHLPGFDSRIIQSVSAEKTGGKKQFGRLRLRWEHYIKTDLQEIELRL